MTNNYRLWLNLTSWWEINEETGEEVLICDTDQQCLEAWQDRESHNWEHMSEQEQEFHSWF